ncbi:MAG: acyltransferase [Bacteroidia bacterium]|nr:acyltransferase [Bacteroidia bacterium]
MQEYPIANILNKDFGINFFYFPYLGTNLPLWTISIEWWLYMFYGFMVFYIFKSKKVGFKELLVLIVLSVSPVYYLLVSTHMEKGLTIFWFLGASITPCLFIKNTKNTLNKLSLILVLLTLLFGMYGFVWFGYQTAALIFLVALFLLIIFYREENLFINTTLYKISERLASFSYSLYLIHYSVLYCVINVLKMEFSMINFLLLLISVNLLSYFFAQLFEVKTKKLKSIYENYRSNNN